MHDRARQYLIILAVVAKEALFVQNFSRAAWLGALILSCGLSLQAFAQEPQLSTPLKNAVILVGANNTNDALSVSAQSGPLATDLHFEVAKELKDSKQGIMTVTNFIAQSPPAAAVATMLSIAGATGSAAGEPVQVPLAGVRMLHLKLTGGMLRPATAYKGTVVLMAGGQTNRWEVTLTTGALGIMAVQPVATLQFTTFPGGGTGSFPLTLYDKSGGGPYHRISARLEPAETAASKTIRSNFSLDTFSFLENKNGKMEDIDLARRTPRDAGEPAKTAALDYREQRTFTARIGPLSPGDYAGALRFISDESSTDALESRLPVSIQVRHHWIIPVVVILLGSFIGWYSSKYAVGVRKARQLARQLRELQTRANFLARPDPSRDGWQFTGEAASYGLARARVMLSQLVQLTSSALPVLVNEQDIKQQLDEAVLRLSGLESFREARLNVQNLADDRPAVQLSLGRLLRRAINLLDQPIFDQAHQAELANLLQTANIWKDKFDVKYREALAERRRSQEIPSDDSLKDYPVDSSVLLKLEELLMTCPSADEIEKTTDSEKLRECDQILGKLALVWRERDMDWAKELAEKCAAGDRLELLFQFVDEQIWKKLAAAEADQLTLKLCQSDQEKMKTYDIVEAQLTSKVPNVSDQRILVHPLHVAWNITPPDRNTRITESHGLILVQYFPMPGQVKVKAALRWRDRTITLKTENDLNFEVVPNPEYNGRRMFGGGVVEYAVLAIAAGFATVTAMGTLYDSTFGSFNQYIALFLWAAGAGTGGNIFKQLGTASAPGGQPDASLSGAGK